jgi:large subunit ribosomal protein L3
MSIGILGTKVGITQIFNEDGNLIPITVIKCGPCYITKIKSINNCGYNAIQVGYLELIKKKLTQYKENLNIKKFYILKEYTTDNISDYKLDQEINLDIFKEKSFVDISALSIGKGNAGNIKKNHFTRGPMSHGSKHHRLQGSIGSGTTPGRVFPGKKMPGRLGYTNTTIKNLKIIKIFPNENILTVKGSIPGKKGTLVNIKNIK